MKFKNFKISVFLLTAIVTLFFTQSVFAENKIDVEDLEGNNLDGKDIFNEKNVYPGWYVIKTVNVQNESKNSKTDLYITFDLENGEKLAEVLKIYVIRNSDSSYRVGGVGDEFTLKTANGKELYIENLDPEESQKYKIVVEFDKNAGNEYQNLMTKFDIDFQIEGKTSKNKSEEEVIVSQRRSVSGQAPAGISYENVENEEPIVAEVEEPKKEIKPVVNEKKDEGIVAGELTCQNRWPFWVWVLLVIIYLILNSFIGSNTETKEENKTSLFWQAIFLIIFLLIWYFFDNCKVFIWVPIIDVIAGLVLAIIFYKNEEKV